MNSYLGLASVMLRVFEYNLAGIRAYEKAGFRRVGIRRKSKFMGGRMWDTVVMDAVAEEFTSPVLGRVLVPDLPRDGSGSTASWVNVEDGRIVCLLVLVFDGTGQVQGCASRYSSAPSRRARLALPSWRRWCAQVGCPLALDGLIICPDLCVPALGKDAAGDQPQQADGGHPQGGLPDHRHGPVAVEHRCHHDAGDEHADRSGDPPRHQQSRHAHHMLALYYFETNLGAAIARGSTTARDIVRTLIHEGTQPDVMGHHLRPRLITSNRGVLLAVFNDSAHPLSEDLHVAADRWRSARAPERFPQSTGTCSQ
jgi:hypothetical protein